MSPLTGIRVVDLTRLLPGAVATQYFSDWGAEVVKVEPSGTGDYARQFLAVGGQAPVFAATNCGKKSVVIDLKNASGREVFLRLVDIADVVIESFRPGVMAGFGLGYEQLRSRNRTLIYVAITGYGQSGPYCDLAGHDLNYLGMAGVLDLIGVRGGAPAIPGVQIADIAGGAMQAVIGTLLGLVARERTGAGQFLDVSMTHGAATMLVLPLAYQQATGVTPERGDDLLSGRYACYNVYRCKDGRWITVAALEDKFWSNLCREIGRPDLLDNQFADEPRQSELKGDLSDVFRQRTAEEWFALLGHKDCCVAPVRTAAEAARDLGLVPAPLQSLARLDRLAATGTVPGLGEHTSDVLISLGYTREEIEDLRRRGAVA